MVVMSGPEFSLEVRVVEVYDLTVVEPQLLTSVGPDASGFLVVSLEGRSL